MTKEQFEEGRRLRDAVYNSEPSMELLQALTEAEKKITWTNDGLSFVGYVDGYSPEFILDLKTTRDASPEKFQRDIFNMQYHVQLAMYGRSAVPLTNRRFCTRAHPFAV